MDHPVVPQWLAAVAAAWLILGLAIYLSLLRKVAAGRGKVSAREFGLPDLFLGSLFAVWFLAAIGHGLSTEPPPVSKADLISGSGVFVAIVLVIALFLRLHGVRAWRQFGLASRNPFACAGLALGLLAAAYPLILAASQATVVLLKGKARPQNIVEFFTRAAQGSDKSEIVLTLLLGVVIAPIAEETIFRGYLYGVLKRYGGGLLAALASALLFAGMHLNAASMAPLFVLALCLTLAYEAFGSLLVNILMHAFFNLSMFIALLWVSHQHGGL